MSSEAVDRAEHDREATARAKLTGGWIPPTEKHHGRHWAVPLDDLQGTTPLNELVWFRMFQPLLLEMANTDEGRELLRIPAECGKIEKIYKNAIHWRTGAFSIDDNGFIRDEWKAIFKVGAYWGNVIRMNWIEFRKLAKTFYEREYEGRKIYRPVLRVEGELVAAHASTTFDPDADSESSSVDGYTMKLDSSDWDTTHDSATGSGSSDTAGGAFSAVGRYAAGNYQIWRGINVLDTSSLGSSASVTAAIWVVTSSGIYDQCQGTGHTENDFGYTAMADCDTLESGTDTAIAVGDYNAILDSTELSDQKDNGGSGGGTYTFNSTGRGLVSTTGKTRFMAREGHDIGDTAFVHSGGGSTEYSGDGHRNEEMETEGLRPYFTVTYDVITSDIQAVNGIALASIEAVNGITAANGEAINGVDF